MHPLFGGFTVVYYTLCIVWSSNRCDTYHYNFLKVYTQPGGRGEWKLQPHCTLLGGGAWQFHSQPRRFPLFHEGAGRKPTGDAVCMAGEVRRRNAAHAADRQCLVLYWWCYIHQWWVSTRYLDLQGTFFDPCTYPCDEPSSVPHSSLHLVSVFNRTTLWTPKTWTPRHTFSSIVSIACVS